MTIKFMRGNQINRAMQEALNFIRERNLLGE
jgi:hypothetical protein